jgi:hypothetical protein
MALLINSLSNANDQSGQNMTKSDDSQGLSERQLKAIPFLVTSPTIEAGCKKANISRETYYLWLSNPAFKAELKKARSTAASEALDVIKGGMSKASAALVSLLENTKSEPLKRAVAIDILTMGMKAVEMTDFEERLSQIEFVMEKRMGK